MEEASSPVSLGLHLWPMETGQPGDRRDISLANLRAVGWPPPIRRRTYCYLIRCALLGVGHRHRLDRRVTDEGEDRLGPRGPVTAESVARERQARAVVVRDGGSCREDPVVIDGRPSREEGREGSTTVEGNRRTAGGLIDREARSTRVVRSD